MATAQHQTNSGLTSASGLDGHLDNIRNKIPPYIRVACFPDSTSRLLRNTILIMAILNGFLLLGSLSTVGLRFMGYSMLLLSTASCIHISCITIVFGTHVADTVGSLGGFGGRLSHLFSNMSDTYGTNAYAHGALFGSTLTMALLMQVASSYYKGVSACVSDLPIPHVTNGGGNLTGGYASMDGRHVSDAFAACGASGPVGFVAFFSRSLFWANAGFAMVLYIKRDELLSGVAPGPSNQHEYDEIGVENDLSRNHFSGDFPSAARTMHV